MKEFKPIKEGKVREVYDNGDSLIISATDRISAKYPLLCPFGVSGDKIAGR